MLTKSDITKLKEIFVTKEELSELEKRLKNDFLIGFDAIMHELKSMREEITIMFYRQSENTEKIESHEVRIKNIEEKISF